MSRIHIILHVETGEAFEVEADIFDTVTQLEDYVPRSTPHIFLYKNTKILPAFSLKWYGIADGSEVYVKDKTKSSNGFRKLFSKPRETQKRRRAMEAPSINPIEAESARIKDQFFAKIEDSPKTYRKMIRRFIRMSDGPASEGQYIEPTILSSEPALGPSLEELPKFWSDDEVDVGDF